MNFNFKVNFDASGLAGNLEDRFGKGSDAQYWWSSIVFEGSRKYLPKVTGILESVSYAHSEPDYADGFIVYGGDGETNLTI